MSNDSYLIKIFKKVNFFYPHFYIINLTMQSMRVQEKNGSDGLYFQHNQDQLYKFRKQTSSEPHMIDRVRKIQLDSSSTNMASCDYSLREQSSLHSQFYSIKMQDMQQSKNAFIENQYSPQDQSSFFKSNSRRQLPNENNTDQLPHNNEQKSQNLNTKHLNHDDSSHQQKTLHNQKTKDCIIQKDPVSNPRKSYTSSLHEIVDRNHLESPSHKLMMQNQELAQFQNFRLQPVQTSFKKNETECSLKIEKINDVSNNQQKIEIIIKPVLVQQKSQVQKKTQSPNSSNKSPKMKSKHNRVQIRKIPSNLYEQYDELLLSVNKNEKPLNKSPLESPIKLKKKSQDYKQSSKDSNEHDDSKTHDNSKQRKARKNKKDEQLLVNLRVVEGFCLIEGQNIKDTIQAKFIINKNEIVFHNYKTITINHITKIKLVHKDEKQLTIKICYQAKDNKKPQTMIVGMVNSDDPFYFAKSYQLYSEIILRKLLLMKLSINEVNEKIQAESYIKSCQSSPTRSPMEMPQSLKVIQIQNKQTCLMQSQLFKKGVIFNSWQKKFFSLSSNCLQSFSTSHLNGQKSKPLSILHKTNEIWTRFELIYGYFVIKLWQNKIQKIQIGIPLCDFTNSQGKNNWLYGLSKEILWGKN